MDDYIKRSDVLEYMRSRLDMQDLYLPIHFIDFVIDEMPAADVVEVVRCKDCKYCGATLSEAERKKAVSNPCSDLVCDMWMSDGFTPGDYCSQGERRNDDE